MFFWHVLAILVAVAFLIVAFAPTITPAWKHRLGRPFYSIPMALSFGIAVWPSSAWFGLWSIPSMIFVALSLGAVIDGLIQMSHSGKLEYPDER